MYRVTEQQTNLPSPRDLIDQCCGARKEKDGEDGEPNPENVTRQLTRTIRLAN